MKKLLWVSDAACPTGFARATHEILDVVRHSYDVTVLGMNYRGDPHPYPYPIYACMPGGDGFGVGRLIWMCDLVRPDVIVFQNDGWNIPAYMARLKLVEDYAKIPVIATLAVDGKNFQGKWLDGVSHAVFWTRFALGEARAGGYLGPASVIPLGVDLNNYYPMEKHEARALKGVPTELQDSFIVGNVNRNQPRKRWDLTIRYFAQWASSEGIPDALLLLHIAPTGDTGVQPQQLAKYYGLKNLLVIEPPMWYGVAENDMRETYNCLDVQITTTQGEGFGLTTFEGMACGVPQIVPAWSALKELTKDAAWQIPCSSTAIGSPYVNVLGGVADEAEFMVALNALYRSKELRQEWGQKGLQRVREARFQWPEIGRQFKQVVDSVALKEEEVPA